MRFSSRLTSLVFAVMFVAAAVGCSNDVVQEDVTSAREKLIEEERETQIAIQETQETISEEEERETAEAREEAEQKIREEEQETREARKNLVELETRLSAQRARDSYLTERELLLTTATLKIEELKNKAAERDGADKKASEKQIQKLEAAHEELADAVAAMKNADPLKWKVEKAATEAAYVELQRVLQNTSS